MSTTKVQNRFIEVPIAELTTSLKDFQGRAEAYSSTTYNRIVNEVKSGNFNRTALPPIQIWKDPRTGKFVILGGHSRTAAFEAIYAGKHPLHKKYSKEDFAHIAAQVVDAKNLDEAKKIAQESNLAGVQSDIDFAKYVREIRPTFQTKAEYWKKMEDLFGANKNYINELSYLNPAGKTMAMLQQFLSITDRSQRAIIDKIASYIGAVREKMPKITNAHEDEIFDWLFSSLSSGNKAIQDKISTKQEVIAIIMAKVENMFFEPDKPLNLNNIGSKTYIDEEYEKLLNEKLQEITQKQKEYNAVKEDLFAQGYSTEEIENALKERDKYILHLQKQLRDLKLKKGEIQLENKKIINLFDQLPSAAAEKQHQVTDLEKAELEGNMNSLLSILRVKADNLSPSVKIEQSLKETTKAQEQGGGSVGGGVKSKVFVHETDAESFDKFDMNKVGSGQGDQWLGNGIYLQEKDSFKIEKYGKNKVETTLNPNAKIFNVENTPNGKYRDSFVEWAVKNTEVGKRKAQERIDDGLSLDNLLARDILKRNPEAVEKLKEQGYDGLYLDGELVVYNPDVLQIKSTEQSLKEEPTAETPKVEAGSVGEHKAVNLLPEKLELPVTPNQLLRDKPTVYGDLAGRTVPFAFNAANGMVQAYNYPAPKFEQKAQDFYTAMTAPGAGTKYSLQPPPAFRKFRSEILNTDYESSNPKYKYSLLIPFLLDQLDWWLWQFESRFLFKTIDENQRWNYVPQDIIREFGYNDVEMLKQIIETALHIFSDQIIKTGASTSDIYETLCIVYKNQPTIKWRSSHSLILQQYSTPIPMAYLLSHWCIPAPKYGEKYLEPSAGTGLLTIGTPEKWWTVNEIDADRLLCLKFMGFENTFNRNGNELLPFKKEYDAILTNPPFGTDVKMDFDGYKIKKLEHKMAAYALKCMKANGRAGIIIGGGGYDASKMYDKETGLIMPYETDRVFFAWLYKHYNVVDIIHIDGWLYTRMGAAAPIRIILIDGEATEATLQKTPLYWDEIKDLTSEKRNSPHRIKDFDILYQRFFSDGSG